MNKNKPILCAVVACALLLAGCAARGEDSVPPGPGGGEDPIRAAGDNERIYSIQLDTNKYWTLDRDGNAVEVDDEGYIQLIDLATGEPCYQYLERHEDTGVRDEWGNPDVTTLCALYDLDGNQLIDWEEKVYLSGFGEYIIRRDQTGMMMDVTDLGDDFQTELYHVPTGESAYDGVFQIIELDGAFVLCDEWRSPFGVVDAKCNPISGFPAPKTYYNALSVGDYFTATTHNLYEDPSAEEKQYLLDRNFRELYTFDWISSYYGGLRGDYITYRDGREWGVLHPEAGVVFQANGGATVEYYDGELAIVQSGFYRSEEDPINASLVTGAHEVLAEGFSWLIPTQLDYYATEPAEQFIGIRDGKGVLIDRAGNELASVQLEDTLSINVLGEGLYIYYVEGDGFYGAGLLDENLEILVPYGTYTYFDLVADYDLEYSERGRDIDRALLLGNKEIGDPNEPGHAIFRMDVLDTKGDVIVDNISTVYDVGPDRIALRRGFQIGLMDWEGNWITSRSMFHSLAED